MAISSNSATTQILLDNSTQLLVKFLYYSANGTDEADVLKVNVETLAQRTFELTVANTANAYFQPGDLLIGATSNAYAYVAEWKKATNTVVVVNLTGNTAFSGSESITIDRTKHTVPLSAFTVPARVLNIESVWYSIDGDATVELGFGGAYANTTPYVGAQMLLSGSGYFGKNALPAEITNDVLNPTGNFFISTYTTTSAKMSYDIVVEFRKTKGFAQRPIY
jgi:hypothetical protein